MWWIIALALVLLNLFWQYNRVNLLNATYTWNLGHNVEYSWQLCWTLSLSLYTYIIIVTVLQVQTITLTDDIIREKYYNSGLKLHSHLIRDLLVCTLIFILIVVTTCTCGYSLIPWCDGLILVLGLWYTSITWRACRLYFSTGRTRDHYWRSKIELIVNSNLKNTFSITGDTFQDFPEDQLSRLNFHTSCIILLLTVKLCSRQVILVNWI